VVGASSRPCEGICEHVLHPFLGPMAGPAGALATDMVQALRAQGIARVDDLVSRAMLDPSLARTLLQRVPAKGGLTPTSMQGRVVLRALAGSAAASANGPVPGTPPRALAWPDRAVDKRMIRALV
jgi:hypothetical protein